MADRYNADCFPWYTENKAMNFNEISVNSPRPNFSAHLWVPVFFLIHTLYMYMHNTLDCLYGDLWCGLKNCTNTVLPEIFAEQKFRG